VAPLVVNVTMCKEAEGVKTSVSPGRVYVMTWVEPGNVLTTAGPGYDAYEIEYSVAVCTMVEVMVVDRVAVPKIVEPGKKTSLGEQEPGNTVVYVMGGSVLAGKLIVAGGLPVAYEV
jgi:hypothetical protein